jgi:hypothetical protein
MTYDMAKLALRVVESRQQTHSHEFRILGREVPHFEVIISLLLEAIKDHCDKSHKGFFVRKLLGGRKRKRTEVPQDIDDEDISGVLPTQKKRFPKVSGPSKQDDVSSADTHKDSQIDIARSGQERTQGSVERNEVNAPVSIHQDGGRGRKTRKVLVLEHGGEQSASSTGFRAIRTRASVVIAPCTTSEREVPCDPLGQRRKCVACRTQAQEHPSAYQQAPAPTAVMVAPTAIMIAPMPVSSQVMSDRQIAAEENGREFLSRDFALEHEEAPQTQSIQAECDKHKIERLEQSVGNMSDFIVEHEAKEQGLKLMLQQREVENRGLRAMLGEKLSKIDRMESRWEEMVEQVVQLKARVGQLEQQAEKGNQLS